MSNEAILTIVKSAPCKQMAVRVPVVVYEAIRKRAWADERAAGLAEDWGSIQRWLLRAVRAYLIGQKEWPAAADAMLIMAPVDPAGGRGAAYWRREAQKLADELRRVSVPLADARVVPHPPLDEPPHDEPQTAEPAIEDNLVAHDEDPIL